MISQFCMKRIGSFLIALMIGALFIESCSSDTTTQPPENTAVTAPLNTAKVTIDLLKIGMKPQSVMQNEFDSVITFELYDSTVSSNTRLIGVLYKPGVGNYPVRATPTGGRAAAFSMWIDVNGTPRQLIAHTGVVLITKFEGKNIVGKLSFTASESGTQSGPQIYAANGEFNLMIP